MADDVNPWAKFLQAPAQTSLQAPAPPDSTPPSPWDKFQPKAEVDYSDIQGLPENLRYRLNQGAQIDKTDQSSWGTSLSTIWENAKKDFAAGYDAAGLADLFAKQRADASRMGWDPRIETTLEEAEKFSHLMSSVIYGAGATTGRMVSGYLGETQREQDKAAEDFGTGYGIAALLLGGGEEPGPLVPARGGQVARVVRSPITDKLEAQVVGGAPTPDTFHQAAISIVGQAHGVQIEPFADYSIRAKEVQAARTRPANENYTPIPSTEGQGTAQFGQEGTSPIASAKGAPEGNKALRPAANENTQDITPGPPWRIPAEQNLGAQFETGGTTQADYLRQRWQSHVTTVEQKLYNMWKTEALHPNELAAAAKEDIFTAHDLGSAATNPTDMPPLVAPSVQALTPVGKLANGIREVVEHELSIGQGIKEIVSPMTAGTPESMVAATKLARTNRRIYWDMARSYRDLHVRFTDEQRGRMWDAAAEESMARIEHPDRPVIGQGLDTLTPEERAETQNWLDQLHLLWAKMYEDGIVSDPAGLPAHTPRMIINTLGHDEFVPLTDKPTPSTRTALLKERKYFTPEETEAAAKEAFGDQAKLLRDIRVFPLAIARIQRVLAMHRFLNAVKEVGERTGAELYREGAKPEGWVGDDSFIKWRHDSIGNKLTPVPFFLPREWALPLKAVLSDKPSVIDKALLEIKGRSMGMVMMSPFIHRSVIWGRAIPLLPGKALTFGLGKDGDMILNNAGAMREAIEDFGVVPVTRNFIRDADMGIGEPIRTIDKPFWGQSLEWLASLYDEKAGASVGNMLEKWADFRHNKLLWDAVLRMQMGIFKNSMDHFLQQGLDRYAAGNLAAHEANRFGGMLPVEAMSHGARTLANLLAFSRSWTFSNLGIFKDAIKGGPDNIMAMIREDTIEKLVNDPEFRTDTDVGVLNIQELAQKLAEQSHAERIQLIEKKAADAQKLAAESRSKAEATNRADEKARHNADAEGHERLAKNLTEEAERRKSIDPKADVVEWAKEAGVRSAKAQKAAAELRAKADAARATAEEIEATPRQQKRLEAAETKAQEAEAKAEQAEKEAEQAALLMKEAGTVADAQNLKLNWMTKKRTAGVIMKDIGMFYVSVSLLQNISNMMFMHSNPVKELEGYENRFHDAVGRLEKNPLSIVDFIQSLSATYDHEPGKRGKILVAKLPDGTGVYIRTPIGKLGEDFSHLTPMDWSPVQFLKDKESGIAEGVSAFVSEKDKNDHAIYDPDPQTFNDFLRNTGKGLSALVTPSLPMDQFVNPILRTAQGNENPFLAAAQIGGQFVPPPGTFTAGQGYPGGPQGAIMKLAKDKWEYNIQQNYPTITGLIKQGRMDEATQLMTQLQIPPKMQNWIRATSINPSLRWMRGKTMMEFYRRSTPEEIERFEKVQ